MPLSVNPGEPKFLADCMLGKLARWLVLLGYDAVFATEEDNDDLRLLERAKAEDRIFLTRDTRIPEMKGLRKIIILEQRFEDQLKRVLKETGLTPEPGRLFTRCTICNAVLDKADRAQILPELPEKVRALDTSFFRCPKCRRLYWSGSHVERALAKLRKAGILESGNEKHFM